MSPRPKEKAWKHPAGGAVLEKTERGTLTLLSRCPPKLFRSLNLDSGLGSFPHYRSIIDKPAVFEKLASKKDGRVAVVLLNDEAIVAYAACWYPEPGDRWNKLGDLMYEMGALEVSRNFRGLHLAKRIFDALMADDFFEDKIAYMNGFSWHWDLDGSGLTLGQYRKMMMKLLRRNGFGECYTNEPNIALREANFFMVRIGSRVSEENRGRFRNLRFGIVDRT
ncbi:N-acetyltransferase [Thermodesulfobacteriota bacterium]